MTTNGSIPATEWVWCGYAGHFIGAPDCRFHLATYIGAHLVSTIGDYYPAGLEERKTLGAGADSWYETYVFTVDRDTPDVGRRNPHGITDYSEIAGERWATVEEAEAGHLAYCQRYASLVTS